jgi:hypothetical protein
VAVFLKEGASGSEAVTLWDVTDNVMIVLRRRM